MSWNFETKIFYILLEFHYNTIIKLYYQTSIKLHDQNSILFPEFQLVTRIPLCHGISLLEFDHILLIDLHYNTRSFLHYWNSVTLENSITLLQFCYVTRNLLDYQFSLHNVAKILLY